jgi:hypothetical protein
VAEEILGTLPWKFSGAETSLDGRYAIGVIYSQHLGCAITEISYCCHDIDEALTKVNIVGGFIVAACNKLLVEV